MECVRRANSMPLILNVSADRRRGVSSFDWRFALLIQSGLEYGFQNKPPPEPGAVPRAEAE